MPADAIRELAHAYATRRPRAAVLDPRHHRAPQRRRQRAVAHQPRAAVRPRRSATASGLNPLRGQNNVQGGGDMGAIPNRLPGFQDILDPAVAREVRAAWGVTIQPTGTAGTSPRCSRRWSAATCTPLYVIGENPAQSEADKAHAVHLLAGLDHLVVQDIFLTKTAELADVVLPGSASWCESEGTVTNSERRVQRVPQGARPARQAHATTSRSSSTSAAASATTGTTAPSRSRSPRTCGTRCARCRRCTPA